MEWYHVYLFTRLENINFILMMCFIITGILTLGLYSFIFLELFDNNTNNNISKYYKIISKRCLIFFCISSILSILSPSQKDIALMYIVPKIINSKSVQHIQDVKMDEFMEFIVSELNKKIENQKERN